MSITNKYAFARAETLADDEDGCIVSWIAECRANTGCWVIRDGVGEDDNEIRGRMFPFTQESDGTMLLMMSHAERKALGMSDAVYQELNVLLSVDDKKRNNPHTDDDLRRAMVTLRARIDALETAVKAKG